MVLIYWTMALPYRVGIGSAFAVGLVLDVIEGSTLGVNALALVVVAYVALSLHQRMRMFSALKQSGLVLALVGLNLMLCKWLQIVSGQSVSSNLMFLMAAVISAVIWPSLFQLLRQIRRSFNVH